MFLNAAWTACWNFIRHGTYGSAVCTSFMGQKAKGGTSGAAPFTSGIPILISPLLRACWCILNGMACLPHYVMHACELLDSPLVLCQCGRHHTSHEGDSIQRMKIVVLIINCAGLSEIDMSICLSCSLCKAEAVLCALLIASRLLMQPAQLNMQPAQMTTARGWLAPAAASLESARHTANRAAHAADKNVVKPVIHQTQNTGAGTKRWLQSVVSFLTPLCNLLTEGPRAHG